MRTEVARRIRWEAAHYLPQHPGNCANVHGHSWSAEVVISGEVAADGMVRDMGDVAAYFRDTLEPLLDHQLLNDTIPAAYQPPSTENVARYLLDAYAGAGFAVVKVTVRETENQTATVWA